jgi:hypothetical protein
VGTHLWKEGVKMPFPAIPIMDKDNNLLVYPKGPGFGNGGAYSVGVATGAVAATSSAGAVLFSFRWTSASKLAVIENVRVNAVVTGTITTSVPYQLALYAARSFTVDYTTNTATATMTGNNAKRRTSMATSGVGSILTLTTVAAGMTGATSTLDTQPLAMIAGNSGTVVGTQFFGAGWNWLWGATGGMHPLVLAANEGFIVAAPLAGPASGTYTVSVGVDWVETSDF